jgi:hypothetical protein
MHYTREKSQKRVLREDKISKHVKVLRELPQDVDKRFANIHRRNEILKANKYAPLKIERDRAHAALSTLPANQQQNLRKLLVSQREDISHAMLALARKGGVP